ncbi:MAG: 50S ribosomal protein L24 [uncultured bacterium]|nr:MAG: 50S ribosomal protein L24 [uncultured bacterium]MDD2656501.1 50S ribosomal protein L24 [Patescibacteria group bacterium]OGH84814.1 MAG: 50S ribosomal protein L24 [Candidatus Magasanikbacteria bacterium RIFOXYC12_FULL_32_21b]OGH91615.1 MAG: 50S ribosomal protein L24 [Candidatus Magasanikbacteria bacterium RIFOXYD12_FULL_33_17]HAO52493.1 50S ribosomal protein L24 [Candidatus Magasanikbacteria bacterium]
MKIKTGDKVKILSGKDRAKTGKVLQVLKNKLTNKVFVVVEGANLLKKHLRAGRKGEKGQIIELPAPLDISNVMLIDSSSKKPTRVGYKIEGGEKKRISKVSGEFVD